MKKREIPQTRRRATCTTLMREIIVTYVWHYHGMYLAGLLWVSGERQHRRHPRVLKGLVGWLEHQERREGTHGRLNQTKRQTERETQTRGRDSRQRQRETHTQTEAEAETETETDRSHNQAHITSFEETRRQRKKEALYRQIDKKAHQTDNPGMQADGPRSVQQR